MKKRLVALTVVLLICGSSLLGTQAHNHTYVLYSKELVYQNQRQCREKPYDCTVTVKGYEARYRCSCGSMFGKSEQEESHFYRH